ncbi:LysE family transporter [bacterium]|jgi:threonine/homoserine/homoserine lactone efflux protein|nr:LysE family transporter [bacterium]
MIISLGLLIRSFCIGFVIATPVGAASILCLRRILTQGYIVGFLSALGIAIGDLFYISVAVFSLNAISDPIIRYQAFIKLAGGIILVFIGTKIFLKVKAVAACPLYGINYFHALTSTFLLTISNPFIIIFLAAILTSIGIQEAPDTIIDSVTLISAAFAGSMSWWVIIIGSVLFFKYQPNPNTLKIINKVSGALLSIAGLLFIIKSMISFNYIPSI